MARAACLALLLAVAVLAQDPASSWLAYVKAPGGGKKVTQVNATWTVPENPKVAAGPNPGFWFGIEPDPACDLIQPILAYGYTESGWVIFNGYFQWDDSDWWYSEVERVKTGDTIYASVNYVESSNSYDMYIGCVETGTLIKSNRPVVKGVTYTDTYFVVEKQPSNCDEFPPNGRLDFHSIQIELEGEAITPDWQAQVWKTACDCKPFVGNDTSVYFTWDGSATSTTAAPSSGGADEAFPSGTHHGTSASTSTSQTSFTGSETSISGDTTTTRTTTRQTRTSGRRTKTSQTSDNSSGTSETTRTHHGTASGSSVSSSGEPTTHASGSGESSTASGNSRGSRGTRTLGTKPAAEDLFPSGTHHGTSSGASSSQSTTDTTNPNSQTGSGESSQTTAHTTTRRTKTSERTSGRRTKTSQTSDHTTSDSSSPSGSSETTRTKRASNSSSSSEGSTGTSGDTRTKVASGSSSSGDSNDNSSSSSGSGHGTSETTRTKNGSSGSGSSSSSGTPTRTKF